MFTEDGDLVNVVGWWWKGRPQIEQKLTDAYLFVFRESTLTVNEVQVKFLTPEIEVAHLTGPWLDLKLRQTLLSLDKASKR